MNILFDLLFMYVVCGGALVAFLHFSDLFFFTSTSYDDDTPLSTSNFAIRALMVCIDTGIFATSIAVWPLVLAACLNLSPIDDDQPE